MWEVEVRPALGKNVRLYLRKTEKQKIAEHLPSKPWYYQK
jgi:hypothetical protein